MKTPAPNESRSTCTETGCGASSCTWLTMKTASIPIAMPIQPMRGSRSPKRTPARTGSTTATSAEIGDATLIGPIARARKSIT